MQNEQDLTDLIAIEGDDELGDVEYHVWLQRAINSGLWHLEGNFGRQMMAAIKNGNCMLGLKSHKDYYGNTVPARTDVKGGTDGLGRRNAALSPGLPSPASASRPIP